MNLGFSSLSQNSFSYLTGQKRPSTSDHESLEVSNNRKVMLNHENNARLAPLEPPYKTPDALLNPVYLPLDEGGPLAQKPTYSTYNMAPNQPPLLNYQQKHFAPPTMNTPFMSNAAAETTAQSVLHIPQRSEPNFEASVILPALRTTQKHIRPAQIGQRVTGASKGTTGQSSQPSQSAATPVDGAFKTTVQMKTIPSKVIGTSGDTLEGGQQGAGAVAKPHVKNRAPHASTKSCCTAGCSEALKTLRKACHDSDKRHADAQKRITHLEGELDDMQKRLAGVLAEELMKMDSRLENQKEQLISERRSELLTMEQRFEAKFKTMEDNLQRMTAERAAIDQASQPEAKQLIRKIQTVSTDLERYNQKWSIWTKNVTHMLANDSFKQVQAGIQRKQAEFEKRLIDLEHKLKVLPPAATAGTGLTTQDLSALTKNVQENTKQMAAWTQQIAASSGTVAAHRTNPGQRATHAGSQVADKTQKQSVNPSNSGGMPIKDVVSLTADVVKFTEQTARWTAGASNLRSNPTPVEPSTTDHEESGRSQSGVGQTSQPHALSSLSLSSIPSSRSFSPTVLGGEPIKRSSNMAQTTLLQAESAKRILETQQPSVQSVVDGPNAAASMEVDPSAATAQAPGVISTTDTTAIAAQASQNGLDMAALKLRARMMAKEAMMED